MVTIKSKRGSIQAVAVVTIRDERVCVGGDATLGVHLERSEAEHTVPGSTVSVCVVATTSPASQIIVGYAPSWGGPSLLVSDNEAEIAAFGSYLVVDWSASNAPTRCAQSSVKSFS